MPPQPLSLAGFCLCQDFGSFLSEILGLIQHSFIWVSGDHSLLSRLLMCFGYILVCVYVPDRSSARN